MASGDEPRSQVIIPSVDETQRDLMVADIGTIIYNVDTLSLNICTAKVAGSTSWLKAATAGV